MSACRNRYLDSRELGSALVAVLWCFAFLGVVAVSTLYTARLEIRSVKNHGDLVQAYYLALAGVEKAKAVIFEEAQSLRQAGKSFSSRLANDPEAFQDVPLGRGTFRVRRQNGGDEGAEGNGYGVSDEESKLNVNLAAAEELRKLPGMADEIVSAILDWRDEDGRPSPAGAEQDYYSGLSPPYRVRNGPLETIRELLMVSGVSPEALLGEDVNANGILDPEEDDGPRSPPMDNADGRLDAGWSASLTVESGVKNVNARGKDRVNIATADADALAAVPGISSDLAKAIVAYRERHPLETIAQLLDVVTVTKAAQAPPGGNQGSQGAMPAPPGPEALPVTPQGGNSQAQAQPQPPPEPQVVEGKEKLVSVALLKEIADEIGVGSNEALQGAVNINTASATVLACLPGLTLDLAQAIVAHRRGNGPFSNIAGLLDVSGMNEEAFKKVCPRVTARSETFRILSEGLVPSTGARKRVEVVVKLNEFGFDTYSYREDL
jgi:competence ComEA-like helix-hairpin-helix protein